MAVSSGMSLNLYRLLGNCCLTKLGPTWLHYLHFLLWCSVQFSMCKAPPPISQDYPRLVHGVRQKRAGPMARKTDSRINRWEWASLASFWLATSSLRSFSKSQPCCDSWVPTSRTGKSWRRPIWQEKRVFGEKKKKFSGGFVWSWWQFVGGGPANLSRKGGHGARKHSTYEAIQFCFRNGCFQK